MFTALEKAKLNVIKQMVRAGKGRMVSRNDKQWVLFMVARKGETMKVEVLQRAAKNGYNVKNIPALL